MSISKGLKRVPEVRFDECMGCFFEDQRAHECKHPTENHPARGDTCNSVSPYIWIRDNPKKEAAYLTLRAQHKLGLNLEEGDNDGS